jgi:hypothetical protein
MPNACHVAPARVHHGPSRSNRKIKKITQGCRDYWHGQGKDVVLCSAPPNGCGDTQHPTWKIKAKKLFKGDQVVGRQGLHTTRSSGRISKRVVFDVPPDLYTLSYKSDAIQGSDLANKKTNL